MNCISQGTHLRDICAEIDAITSRFTSEQIESMFNPANHIGVSGELVDEAVALARGQISPS